jgi:hypothetical protein
MRNYRIRGKQEVITGYNVATERSVFQEGYRWPELN